MPKHHTHKLKRVTLGSGSYEVYRCMQTGCTTYYPLAMVPGQLSQCWSCSKVFEFKGTNLRQVKPKCYDCTGKKKVGRVAVAAESLLDRLRGDKL